MSGGWRSATEKASRLAMHLVDFALPPFCFDCHARIAAGWLCDECRRRLRSGWIDVDFPVAVTACHSVWAYRDAVRDAIEAWKFTPLPALGNLLLADAFSDDWIKAHLTPPYAAIVGIPPHTAHQRERGFDPVAQMMEFLSNRLGAPIVPSLRRVFAVKPQVASAPTERQRNVKGCFAARVPLKGRVLLVDDVLTTGSTLNEAAGTLASAGECEITILVIANVVGAVESKSRATGAKERNNERPDS